MKQLISDDFNLKNPEDVIKEYNELLKKEGTEPHAILEVDFIKLNCPNKFQNQHNIRILGVFQEDSLEEWSEEVPANEFRSYPHQVMKKAVMKKTFALVGRTASEIVERMGNRICTLHDEAEKWKDTLTESNQVAADLRKENEQLTLSKKNFTERIELLREDLDKKHVQVQKYEQDFSKLRKALGELRINEIIG